MKSAGRFTGELAILAGQAASCTPIEREALEVWLAWFGMPDAVLTFMFFGTAIIGLLTAWIGWRGRTPGASRWCPRCEQDLSDTESRICPGCGFKSTSEKSFHIRPRRWGVVIIGLLITVVSSLGASRTGLGPAANQLFVPAWQLEESQSLGSGWFAEVRRSSGEGRTNLPSRARVYRNGSVMFEWQGQFASLGAYAQGKERWGLGSDIDGDSSPDLVIETRGTDGIERTLIFSLSTNDGIQRLEPMAILPDGRFEDLDEDGFPEYLLEDQTYLYRLGGLHGGPRPTLVMVSDNRGGWRYDPAKTRGRPMPEDWERKLAQKREAIVELGQPDYALVHEAALELLYRGRSEEAAELLQNEFSEEPDQIKAFYLAVQASPLSHHLPAMPSNPHNH